MTLILQLAAVLLGVYALMAALYIVLENRTPQSTFAWLFLFLLVPLAGMIVYRFAGRDWRAFSKENELVHQELGSDLVRDLGPILARQRGYIDRLASEHPASYRRKLLQLVQRNGTSLFTARNEVAILQDASQKYPRLLADLRAARHHIHLNYYIWTEDSFTSELKDVLIERARVGVKVRCLFDASGGALSKGYLRELRAAGVAIHPYLEFRSFTKLHSINYRSHRKIAVIDGRIGYTGGLNLDKEQLHPTAFPAWRDTHLRVVGEAAQGLQASFAVSWFNTTGEEYHDPEYYPRSRAIASSPCRSRRAAPIPGGRRSGSSTSR